MDDEERRSDNHNDDTLGCFYCNTAAHPAALLSVGVTKDEKNGTDFNTLRVIIF